MKINNQTIPPELATAYAKLISRKPTGAGQNFSARTKPRALKKAPTRKPREQIKSIEAAVDFLIAFLTEKDGYAPDADFRAAQIAALKAGTFDQTYWVKCKEESSTTLENAPTSGAFIGPRNYAYPDPTNQPSTPTYGAGVPASGDPAYTGWTTGGIFSDTGLRWIRKVFTLANKFTRGVEEPLFLKLSGSITASANARPSRAMISAIIKRWIVADGSARLTTTEAPVIKPISAFWRYRTPRGVAPYFALTKPLSLMYNARSLDYEELTGDITSAVVLVAPMPMMGKRYNNNTSITSTIAATLELWQIKKGNPGFWVRNWLIHADGTYEPVTSPNAYWFVFFDSAHGLMGGVNATTGLKEYFLLDGKLNKTPYAAPWQALPDWDANGFVANWYPSATGYLIAVENSNTGSSNFYYLNADGTIASQGDGASNPKMWAIIWQNQGVIAYAPWLDAYLMDGFPSYGDRIMSVFSTAGELISQYDYSGDGIENQGNTFASDTAGYAISSSSSGGIRTVKLWRMTSQPLTLVATFTVGNSQHPGVGYNAGIFYIFCNNTTGTSKTVTEAGVVASLSIQSNKAPIGTIPVNTPWITNA